MTLPAATGHSELVVGRQCPLKKVASGFAVSGRIPRQQNSSMIARIAGGGHHILAEAAGITAGSWYASPAAHVGHELVAAGMLILAGGGNGKWLAKEINVATRSGTDEIVRS